MFIWTYPLFRDEQGFCDLNAVDEIIYGVCNVYIPRSHKPGSVGTSWWRRWLQLEEDDSLKRHDMHGLPKDAFWNGLSKKLKSWWNPGERNVFVFIHGYNVSFEEAAIRAAQIGYDLKVPGEMAFFSWPSQGGTSDYFADEASITSSVIHIAAFLQDLCTKSGAERVHVFVHSMGNRGFLNALVWLAATGHPALKFGQIFFCAPDEDVRTFRNITMTFPHQYENRTILVSPEDKAVFLSQRVHQKDRVGFVPPVAHVTGIETIEVGGLGIMNLGHGYFAEAEPLIKHA